MNNPVIQCDNVTKTYQDGEQSISVLKGISLTIHQGESVAIVGASGSGKSTLLHLLGTLELPSSGDITIAGKDVLSIKGKQKADFRNQSLGFIYQFHHLLAEFSALENVAMPLIIRGEKKTEALKRAEAMCERVGLKHRLHHLPAQMSGGERQRAAIARAVVGEPALVLADEPTGNLDKENAEAVMALIQELNQTIGTSFVVVTHDLNLAQRLNRVVTLDDGQLVKGDV